MAVGMGLRDNRMNQVAAHIVILTGSVLFALGQDAKPSAVPPTELIVERMMTTRSRQARQLQSLDVIGNYRVDYQGFGGTRHAEMQVVSTYVSPDKKEFRIVSQTGSRFLLDHILSKLLESERDYQADQAASDLSPRNYDFMLLGTEQVAGNDAFKLQITPRRKAKYLCRGTIWVSTQDFAIVRLEGEPARNPSFWISHTEMANTYEKIGDFWLPVHKDAKTDVRLGGKAVLSIDYSGYRVTQNTNGALEASRLLWAVPQSRSSIAGRP